MTTESLVSRLEGASEGSRELDARVWCAVEGIAFKKMLPVPGLPNRQYSFRTNKGDIGLHGSPDGTPIGYYTTSIDAAVSLAEMVLPGARWVLVEQERGWGVMPMLFDGAAWDCPNDPGETLAPTLPLAICAAILRAKETHHDQ